MRLLPATCLLTSVVTVAGWITVAAWRNSLGAAGLSIASRSQIFQGRPDSSTAMEPMNDSRASGGGTAILWQAPPPPTKLGPEPAATRYRQARAALEGFLGARTAEHRSIWCEKEAPADRLDRPIAFNRIVHLSTESASTGRFETAFKVETPECPDGMLVTFDHTLAGPKTSAALFVQQHEHWLERFLAGKVEGTHTLFVAVSNAHSFEGGAPEAAKFVCVNIQSPLGQGLCSRAYVERESEAGRALEQRLPWGETKRALVELTWAAPVGGNPGSMPLLLLRRIVDARW
ncbi:MAG: hypothetical protein ACR2OZ_10300 [Verrucomicrobiales bacterium]